MVSVRWQSGAFEVVEGCWQTRGLSASQDRVWTRVEQVAMVSARLRRTRATAVFLVNHKDMDLTPGLQQDHNRTPA